MFASSVSVAEALAFREASIFCVKTGISRVGIEGDCANVIAWCSFGSSDPPWEVAPIISDIRSFLRGVDVSFTHVRRSTNRVADFVARYVARNGWLGSGISRAAIFD